MAFPESFWTTRMHAERLRAEHLPDLLKMFRDPAITAELGGLRDEEWTAAYLARNLDHWSEYGFGVWILRGVHGEDVIGRAILRRLRVEADNSGHDPENPRHSDEVELGYAFYPEFWGQGLATEVARALIEFGFGHLQLGSLVAETTLSNLPSQRVLTKAGFTQEREILIQSVPCVLFRLNRS